MRYGKPDVGFITSIPSVLQRFADSPLANDLPIVDQHTYLGVETSKGCSWDTGKGKAHVGQMDAILTDSRLGTRSKRCILMNVTVLELRRGMGRER